MTRSRYKCCFIGNFSVGKTSIIHSILNNRKEVQSTMGIDFFSTTTNIGNTNASVTIWDTAGAERYRSLTSSYIRDSDIIFIVYDLSTIDAMSNVSQCLLDVERSKPSLVVIMGNKSDLHSICKHNLERTIEPYTRQGWDILTTVCSVYDEPTEIKEFFKKCLRKVAKRGSQISNEAPKQIRLVPQPELPRKCCT